MLATPVYPFRWDVTQPSQHGQLLADTGTGIDSDFMAELIQYSARILALSNNSDLYFVGRSPDNFYDYLSGALFETGWRERLHLLPFSMFYWDEADVKAKYPGAIEELYNYLDYRGLNPRQLVARKGQVALVDLVSTGKTLGRLVQLLYHWSEKLGVDWAGVRPKLRIIGITRRDNEGPKTWRWHKQAAWTSLLESGAIKNIAASNAFWSYLADRQPKISNSYQVTGNSIQ